jgi:hypothetical protein
MMAGMRNRETTEESIGVCCRAGCESRASFPLAPRVKNHAGPIQNSWVNRG